MQALKEMILLLDMNKSGAVKQLFNGSDKSKLYALYEGILKSQFKSDADAAAILYGEDAEGSSYRKLKSDLRDRLFEAMHSLDPLGEDYTDYQKSYYESNRNWLTVRILSGKNANVAAVMLANRVLRQAMKFDLTLLCMDISAYLRIQYSIRESNDKKFQEIDALCEHYRKLYDAESIAEKLYYELVSVNVNSRSAYEKVRLLSEQAHDIVTPFLEKYASYKLQMYGYVIAMMYCTSRNEYARAIEYGHQALSFFHSRPYEAPVPLQVFYYQLLVCHIHLKQFAEGKQIAEKCGRYMQEGTFNWFKYKELYLLLSLHTRNYEAAVALLSSSLDHPRFEFLPENSKELWRVYEAYVCFLSMKGILPEKLSRKFKLAKFINETPIFAKDKGGVNISIIVARILFLLEQKNYKQLLDDTEAIHKYCNRYLRNEFSMRSYYFIKALTQILLDRFDIKSAQPKAKIYLDQMNAIPMQVSNQAYEIEIIPYEDLWEMILTSITANASVSVARRLGVYAR